RIVFRRDDHFERRRQGTIASNKFRTILEERSLVRVCFDAARLIASGPYLACVHITEKHVASPAIACHILTPAGYRKILPPAVSRPGNREHHDVSPVGKQVSPGCRGLCSAESADDRWNQFTDLRAGRHVLRTWPRHHHVARRPLLQQ